MFLRRIKISKKLSIATATAFIVFAVVMGVNGLKQQEIISDYDDFHEVHREIQLLTDLDRQVHRIWVKVLALPSMTEDGDVSISEFSEKMAEIRVEQKNYNSYLDEFKNGVFDHPKFIGQPELMDALITESALHDEFIEGVITGKKEGKLNAHIDQFKMDGMISGQDIIDQISKIKKTLKEKEVLLDESFDAGQSGLKFLSVATFVLGLLLFIVFYYVMKKLVDRSLSEIATVKTVAVEIAQGNMDVEINPAGHDEVAELLDAIDQMRNTLRSVMGHYDKLIEKDQNCSLD